ncbi:hypothetical protein GIB67_035150 [Kingdonia uniflora]|uniref:ABC transmembrane type-1 domain-containing protein n=1 Tax=Kingdonia uniflora TaxID=39325 RepID=A0A7J7LDM3_9MAGN|nr:hypothetical protein GIB67_035150 [Kingdonia uniflora]
MVLGTISAVVNGVAMPAMCLLIGDLTHAFGQNNADNMVHVVFKIALKYVYLGLGASVASFFQMAFWIVTGERQAGRIRSLYLKTILRQDIAFFDNETNTGRGCWEDVGSFINLIVKFIAGFVIAFMKGWLLTLVMLFASCPLVITSSALMYNTIINMAHKAQAGYSQADVVVEQTIGSIRTVASFTGEKEAITKYDQSLMIAYKSTLLQGFANGIGRGGVLGINFFSYSLAIWLSGDLIINKGYTGGDVLSAISDVMMGEILCARN